MRKRRRKRGSRSSKRKGAADSNGSTTHEVSRPADSVPNDAVHIFRPRLLLHSSGLVVLRQAAPAAAPPSCSCWCRREQRFLLLSLRTGMSFASLSSLSLLHSSHQHIRFVVVVVPLFRSLAFSPIHNRVP